MGPLKDLKVLDFTRVLAGPYCTMILADLGAEVIKVERPGSGDDSRQFGPYLKGESGYFMSLNRNKYSITLNLKDPKAVQMVKDMIGQFDVLVENFKPGTLEKMGLGYDELKKIHPGLIYAAASGFGQTGPYSPRPAYDGVVQAMGGIMSITGARGGEPTRVGPSIGDIAAGVFTAIGVLSALHHREKTGEGQMVDVAMLDCQVSMLENAIARYAVTGDVPKPIGNRHASIVPFEPFETKDRPLMIAVGNDRLWTRFTDLIGVPELGTDDRFKTNPLRNENYDALRPLLAERLKEKTVSEWQQIFDEGGIPNGPINSVDQIVENEQIKARDMIVEVDHPVAGKLMMPGIPIKLSKTPGSIHSAAPILAADNEWVFKKYLGYDEETLEKLKAEHVI